jgi:hypothetical protein
LREVARYDVPKVSLVIAVVWGGAYGVGRQDRVKITATRKKHIKY